MLTLEETKEEQKSLFKNAHSKCSKCRIQFFVQQAHPLVHADGEGAGEDALEAVIKKCNEEFGEHNYFISSQLWSSYGEGGIETKHIKWIGERKIVDPKKETENGTMMTSVTDPLVEIKYCPFCGCDKMIEDYKLIE